LVTPIGSLSQEDKQEPVAGTAFRTRFLIQDIEDCEIMQYIYEHRVYEPDYSELKRRIDDLGDDGLVAFFGLRSPLQMLLEELAGLETTIFLLNDYPDVVESLLKTIHEKNKEAYQILAGSPVELVISCEDTSTTMISPRIFEKYVVPFLNDYAGILHAANKIHGVHMCGHIKGLLGLIQQLDVDGLESVTPPPTGNVELAEAKSVLGDEFFIVGGLDAPSVKSKTVQEIKAWVRDLLLKVSVREGLILQVTDDVSAGTPLDNLKAVGQAIEEYG
jgi:uroporphyrinogen-III decarboxylase